MSDPFEIIDPVERFAEARAEAVAPGIGTARSGRRPRTHRALWLAGAVLFATCTVILVHIVGPRLEGDPASKLSQQSVVDTSSQPPVSSRQPGGDPKALIPASSPPARGVHAIDPEAKAEQGSDVQLQASQEPTALPDVTGALAQSNATPPNPAAPETGDAQWVKTSLAAKAHSEPSVSAPILKYYPLGTELRVTARQNGWVQIADPATSEQGWIYAIYLAPNTGPGEGQAALPQQPPSPDTVPQSTQAELDTPDESGNSSPDSSAPVAKAPRHYGSNRFHGRPAIVIRFHLPRFW
jgi:hypothetical protein